MSDIQQADSFDDLTQWDEVYEEAAEAGFKPDGNYQSVIEGFELKRTKSSNEPMIAWSFGILVGEFSGQKMFKNAVLSDRAMPYIKADLKTVGLDDIKISDLSKPEVRARVIGKQVEIQKKTTVKKETGEEFENIYIKHLISVDAKGSKSASLDIL